MPRAGTSAPHAEPDNQQQQQHHHRGNSPPPHLEYTVTCLWVLTPLTATLSLVIVCVAMTTNQWLHTEEKMNNPGYNGTGEKDYLSKNTVSGLWTLCYSNPGEKSLQCYNIDYFPREEYSPDPNDSTMAIPYAVTKSAVFFFLATLFLFVGEFCCLFGHFARHRRLFTFISGLICIISGLLMLIGLVMYISIFKAEIGNKLRPLSQLQPPLFTYRYGFSFLLVVSGFMASEIAGTCAIFLYIYWHQLEWGRKRHEAHLHRRKMSASSMLLDHHHLQQQQQPPPGMLYPCRRHPQQPPPNILRPFAYTSPNLQRRFYLERGETTGSHRGSREASPCPGRSDHPIPAVAGSLRDISISSSYYSFPAPSSGPYQHQQHHYYHHHGGGGDEENACTPPPLDLHPSHPHSHLSGSRSSFFPRDATTNTVSTTADINSCEGGDSNDAAEGVDDEEEEYSPSLQHENEFVTFDLDEHHHHHQQHHHQHHPYPVVPPMPSIRSAPAAPPPPEELPYRRKDYGYDTLRRTTPV